jgi:von Willebrand factor type A domain
MGHLHTISPIANEGLAGPGRQHAWRDPCHCGWTMSSKGNASMLSRSSLGLLSALVLALVACGSPTPGATYDGGAGPAKGADAGPPSNDGGSGKDGLGFALDGEPGEGGDSAACATDKQTAKASPAYLVFLMDRSDSMKDDSKWTSCSTALESFFSSTTTTALSASLTFLPFETKSGKKETYSCTASDYETPAVSMTAIPSGTFATTIAATTLENGTPTEPALEGTVEYAAGIQKAHPGGKVLIVLATDGLPVGCTGNTVTTVAAEAATALSTYKIPTYVIGVGSATKNLDTIAASGGTTTAFIVSTSDPATTTSEFEAAIATIQGTLGCDYPIQSPGGGQTIDYTKVNVELTSSGGTETELLYSSDCSDANGWHYDDPKAPTTIILCSGACKTAESTSGDSMDIVFGCKTNGAPP